jgi:hypothetical protein
MLWNTSLNTIGLKHVHSEISTLITSSSYTSGPAGINRVRIDHKGPFHAWPTQILYKHILFSLAFVQVQEHMKLIYGAHATHFYTDKKNYHTRKVEQLVPLSVRLTHVYSTIEGNVWFPVCIVEQT